MKVNPHRSSFGMDANIMAMLCYLAAFVLSWIPVIKYVAWAAPLVFFLLEKESPFVKFHAMQALVLEGVCWVFTVVLGIITAILTASAAIAHSYSAIAAAAGIITLLGIIFLIIAIILTIFAVIAMVKAYNYFEYKIPVVGNLSEKFSRKGNIPR